MHTAFALAALAGLSACDTIDDSCPLDTGGGTVGDSLHIRLTIDTRGQETRADGDRPYGGEQGDGWEYGSDNENKVQNVCIFAYRGKALTDLTPAEAAALTIEARGYASVDKLTEETGTEAGHEEYEGDDKAILTADFIFHKGEKMSTNNLQFIVVANVGDITTKVSSVKDVCDYQDYLSWTVGEDSKPTLFAMSSTTNSYSLGGEGTADDPIRYHIDIERTAARIDFDFGDATLTADNELQYKVMNPENTEQIAQLYLKNVKVVNACVLPTYMLKRVANDVNGSSGFQYLGDEKFSKDGTATNYVIDPRTSLRTGTFDESWPDAWYKSTHMYASLAETYADDAPIGGSTDFYSHIDWSATGTKVTGYTVGYVNENTFDKDQTVSVYATGLVLKGIYVPDPKKVYASYDAEKKALVEATPEQFSKGKSFWRFVKNGTPAEQYCIYFSNKEAADAYCAVYNANNKDGGTVSDEYVNGQCYYYVWLRHANNSDGAVQGPMEFGIVRNNIYRLKVSSVGGPGTADPDPRNPEYLKTIIYVRKWREVSHPEIIV